MTSSNYSPLAESLNQTIAQFPIASLLSETGKRAFYPTKGIVAQSAEAKEMTDPDYNATVGIATDGQGPLGFKSIQKFYNTDLLSNSQIFDYSGSYGNPKLRKLWKERLVEINPHMAGKNFSTPIVTGGLTNALSITADLFFGPDDTLILPDQIWGNYKLMFDTIRQTKITYFPFFEGDHFNLTGFEQTLKEVASENKTIKLLLNFPNNPTGYSPTQKEADKMLEIFTKLAEQGNKILIILDEAYHGLFFEDDLIQESLFSKLVNLHTNILTVKICGATKEFYAWGLRVGFLSFGTKGGSKELYTAFEQKSGGLLRGNISNVSTSSQHIIATVLEDKSYLPDFNQNYQTLKERAQEVKRILTEHTEYQTVFNAYPFNSGYFMLLKLNDNLESDVVRKELLKEKIGTISTAKHDLRVAFSSVEKDKLETVFEKIYEVCKKLS